MKKRYVKSDSICKVTFILPKEAAGGAKYATVVGEFNDWSISANPMKQLKNGEFKTIVDLESDREYKFRYLVNGERWENDWNADKYLKNVYGTDDSVVIV